MTDVTYGKVVVEAPAVARKSVWRRILDAMIEARMRQAERIVRDYRELI